MIGIRDVMTDPALLGDQFGGDSWAAGRALLAGFYGEALDSHDLEHWRRLTGLQEPPRASHEELWLAVGRRGGKSQCAALLAVFEAAFSDHSNELSPGEVATVMILAANRQQARSVFRYISGLFESNPMLSKLVLREDRESIELSNRTIIEVQTASFRATRGYTVSCCIADEIAFWRSEDSANPDFEILNAIRPAMATLGGKLIAVSSPYSKRGALYETYKSHYAKPGPILVAKAPSRVMNPSLSQRVVDQAMERDPAAASAEYMAEFRSDLEEFVSAEVVTDAVRSSPLELPYARDNRYFAFVDPSGGGADGFCLAIGHEDQGRIIVDLVREQHGAPAAIAAGYAELLKSYGIMRVQGDKYAGSWPADEFSRHGIQYVAAGKPKSDLYVDALAALNSSRVELPPLTKLTTQLCSLERRTSRSGRDSIDHPPGGHDDLANAVAGLISSQAKAKKATAVFGTYSSDALEPIQRGYRMNEYDPAHRYYGKQTST